MEPEHSRACHFFMSWARWIQSVPSLLVSGCTVAQAVSCWPINCRGLGSILDQFIWDLWWTKWHWYRFFSKYISFFLSLSFHIFTFLSPTLQNLMKWQHRFITYFTSILILSPQVVYFSLVSQPEPYSWPQDCSRSVPLQLNQSDRCTGMLCHNVKDIPDWEVQGFYGTEC